MLSTCSRASSQNTVWRCHLNWTQWPLSFVDFIGENELNEQKISGLTDATSNSEGQYVLVVIRSPFHENVFLMM